MPSSHAGTLIVFMLCSCMVFLCHSIVGLFFLLLVLSNDNVPAKFDYHCANLRVASFNGYSSSYLANSFLAACSVF